MGCGSWRKVQEGRNICIHIAGKDPDAGKDRGQKEKDVTEDEMVR